MVLSFRISSLLLLGLVILVASAAAASDRQPQIPVPTPKDIIWGQESFFSTQPIEYIFSFYDEKDLKELTHLSQISHFHELGNLYKLKKFNPHLSLQKSELSYKSKSKFLFQIPSIKSKVNVVIKDFSHFNTIKNVEDLKENYNLVISETMQIEIRAENYVGFLRALETIAQLIETKISETSEQNQEFLMTGLPIKITDSPSYSYRGIMLDCSRHFITTQEILKTIEGMVATQLNVLHLHLTDSESFAFQLNSFPQITKSGAYSDSEIYSVSDMESLINYGQMRGVIIIPETDMPAHTRSWSNDPTMNDIDACRNYVYENWRDYCLEPPCGQLDPTIDKSYEVVGGVLQDIQQTFTSDYVHLGGDEAQAGCWNAKPSIKDFMNQNGIKDYYELQSYFRKRADKYVDKSKTKIYWYNGDATKIALNSTDIVQYWDSIGKYKDLGLVNNQVILSPYDQLYLDCGITNLIGGQNWCELNTWTHIYKFNPNDAKIDQSRILGAQACLWTETVQNNQIQEYLWPRATALAMRLWNENENLGTLSLAQRLYSMNTYLKQQNISSQPISSQICEKNLDWCFSNV